MAKSTVSTFHHHVLGVPMTTRQVRYTDKAKLLRIYDEERKLVSADTTNSKSPFILVTNIDLQAFKRDFSTDEESLYDSFEHDLQLLVVKMPLSQHEKAIEEFNRILIKTLGDMNDVDLELDLLGTEDRSSASRTKRPDKQFLPKVLPPDYSGDWPTLPIESGWSESRAKLERDASWWLTAGEGEVKVAITISTSRTRKKIEIRTWELVDRPTRRQPTRKTPAVTQHVVLMQKTPKDPVTITSCPLTIDFAKLFLREPNSNSGESNIVLGEDVLEYYALAVWR